MVLIPQHPTSTDLIDLKEILELVDQHLYVENWLVEVEDCVGGNADEVVASSRGGCMLSNSALRAFYHGIQQTNNGMFTGFISSKEVINLIAIDSTCWEVESVDQDLLAAVSNRFGTYP